MSSDPTHTQRAARDLVRLGGPWFLAGVTLAACGYVYGLDSALSVFSVGASCTSLAALLYLMRRHAQHAARLRVILGEHDQYAAGMQRQRERTRELVLSIPPEQRHHVPDELLRALTEPNP